MALDRRELVAGIVVAAVGVLYGAATWDVWAMNAATRYRCDEDRPFSPQRRRGVEAIGVRAPIARRDPKLVPALARYYPSVVVVTSIDQPDRPRYEVAEFWPTNVSRFSGYQVIRRELTLIDLVARQVLATGSTYEGVDRSREGGWWKWRTAVVPDVVRCVPSERVDFIRTVLRPP